jgi:hypothetical protein
MNEVAGTDPVGGDDDLGMETGTKEIDRHHGGASGIPTGVERLAEQHFAALEGGMRVAADSVTDDLGGDHEGELR